MLEDIQKLKKEKLLFNPMIIKSISKQSQEYEIKLFVNW